MNWDEIEKQEFAIKVLTSHLGRDRLASTYLISGANREHREEFALAFASALNCEDDNYFVSCLCRSCHKINAAQHPDIRWMGMHEDKNIKIEETREAAKWVYLKPYEGKRKVFIITDADRLTMDASNTLLKTLEEPPEKTVYLLLSESKSSLLETIQSRTFHIRLKADLTEPGEENENFQELVKDAGKLDWEDYLDQFKDLKREELTEALYYLSLFFRNQIEKGADSLQSHALLQGMDLIYETREAVHANVNMKLALTRLAMKLRRILPTRVAKQ